MSSSESTVLILLSLLELPNIGRKTVFNFFSNLENEKILDFRLHNKQLNNHNINDYSILEKLDSFNSQHYEKSLSFEKKIDSHFIDYKIRDNISVDFLEIFLKKFKISNNEWNIAQDKARKIFEFSEMLDIKIVSYFDENYPSRLRTISDPPQILYCNGNIDFLSKNLLIALVGTREPTEYGARTAERLGGLLANCDVPVVSGLAAGCDAYAQQGCVNRGGQTVAVLAHGLDHIYPKQNESLARQILSEKGCLISEYPPGVRSTRFSFVDRDRIQSGLSDGVVVIETDVKGGTMHTVNNCLKQNRLLGCLSHPNQYLSLPQSAGNQLLINERKATPINIEYFEDGCYSSKEYNDSILGFIKKIIELKKTETPNIFEIIEKFHEYMYKDKAIIEKITAIDTSSDKFESKKVKNSKIKKSKKITDASQKNLIEADNAI